VLTNRGGLEVEGGGSGFRDLRLIERSHLYVTLGGPCCARDVAQARGRQVEA
jgi:hypothetical protein